MGVDKVHLKFHVGGRLLVGGQHDGGETSADMRFVETLDFNCQLDLFANYGYPNVGTIWYKKTDGSLEVVDLTSSKFSPFLSLYLEVKEVQLFVEYLDRVHPLLLQKLKDACVELGINECDNVGDMDGHVADDDAEHEDDVADGDDIERGDDAADQDAAEVQVTAGKNIIVDDELDGECEMDDEGVKMNYYVWKFLIYLTMMKENYKKQGRE
ncbi:hypothetical protein Tsubulata_027888 [Turnera subulata]|uniref:Uncharacterized protein n=1 Tax=Turnera subulata TaxID=218843 RepID=A0A9Q0JS82_9ROSI|nr:hypothetical protein Tsubulata_027888 [Turnera subulata]